MAELKKLFVHVPATITNFDGATVSAANANKIYFEEYAKKIWNNGVAFGINDSDLWTIADGEKILALSSDNKLSSTLSLDIAKESDVTYLYLKGIDGAEVAKVDATAFVKDGMLESAELITTAETGITVEVPYIKLTWNTDAEKDVIRFSVKDLVDIYTVADDSANYLGIDEYKVSAKLSTVTYTAATESEAAKLEATDGIVAGKDVATIKSYVDAVANGLDADVASDDAAVATVEVKEEAGKISDVVVTTVSAGVAYTVATESEAAKLEASTTTGAVTGADIATIKSYVDAQDSSIIDELDADIKSNDAETFASESEYVAVEVKEEDGKITDVNVAFDPWETYTA